MCRANAKDDDTVICVIMHLHMSEQQYVQFRAGRAWLELPFV